MTERRKWALLSALIIVLVVAAYQAMRPPPLPGGGDAPVRRDTSTRAPQRSEAETLEVRLDALDDEWPGPETDSRNLFQVGRARPVGVPERVAPPPMPPPIATGPPPAPAVPPIPLTLIGVVAQREAGEPIAVLRDARGVYHGRAGDVIEGRYRILRVTSDAVEISHLDGRGRQMMRLGGS
jgi:hypothetical protein